MLFAAPIPSCLANEQRVRHVWKLQALVVWHRCACSPEEGKAPRKASRVTATKEHAAPTSCEVFLLASSHVLWCAFPIVNRIVLLIASRMDRFKSLSGNRIAGHGGKGPVCPAWGVWRAEDSCCGDRVAASVAGQLCGDLGFGTDFSR